VFVLEAMRGGVRYSLNLDVRDEELALGELARFNAAPGAYGAAAPAPASVAQAPVFVTDERLKLYLASIRGTVKDHRAARFAYLTAWAKLGLDLRTVDKRALRSALATWDGGHRGRVEALNAFARFLVKEGDLTAWLPLENPRPPAPTRAERRAYSLEELRAAYARLSGPVRDLFLVRAATGMHHTEIAQLRGAPVLSGPLPDKGPAIRELPAKPKSEIAGVLQVRHKNGQPHRVSVDAATLAAALRLRDRVPDRITAWEQFDPLVPSNLRHTFVTLAGEVGELVAYVAAGVDRARIAQAVGHRAGSTMIGARYDKLQVPAMIKLPLEFKG
jgi:hypothetical protein